MSQYPGTIALERRPATYPLSYKVSNNLAADERLYVVEPRSAATDYYGVSGRERGEIASIKLITTNGALGGVSADDRFVDSGMDSAAYTALKQGSYDRFLLSSCAVSYSEKTQIMSTFGDNEVVYYFGKNPVVMELQGILIDSLTNDWFGSFINMYATFFRGTQLAKNFEMLELVLPNMKVIGSIISLSHQQNSTRDTDIPFSMQFYAKKIEILPQHINWQGPLDYTNNSVFIGVTNRASGSYSENNIGGFSEPAWLQSSDRTSSYQPTSGIQVGYSTFRNNIYSPVVSTIAGLTKRIQVINKDVNAVVSSLTDPINAVLRDIMSISVQASAVATLLERDAAKLGHALSSPGVNLRNTLSSLKNTAGVISRLPESVSEAFKRNYFKGRVRSAAVLHSSAKSTSTKAAALKSGSTHTVQSSFII